MHGVVNINSNIVFNLFKGLELNYSPHQKEIIM